YFVDPGAAAVAARPVPADLSVDFTDLRFTTVDGRPDRLTATMSFTVTGPDAAGQAQYLAHVVVTAEDPAETRVVAAKVGRLAPGGAGTDVTMVFDAPAPGRYQLLGAVIVIPCEAIRVEPGPRLRVTR
ncbi:MAG: hypothetical protein ABW022_19775, partial [Actinoplanes sp.]